MQAYLVQSLKNQNKTIASFDLTRKSFKYCTGLVVPVSVKHPNINEVVFAKKPAGICNQIYVKCGQMFY